MNFIAIDFETAQPSRESACSIGLVKYIDGKPADTFYSLIRPPELYINPRFTEIHGITVKDVKDAPSFADIWDSGIKQFSGDLPLAAHYASFDMGVLCAALEWYDLEIPKLSYFCTCSLARRAWPRLESHSLSFLAKKFNIVYEAHNALEDALTCGRIALSAAEKYKTKSVEGLISAAKIKLKTLGFDKD